MKCLDLKDNECQVVFLENRYTGFVSLLAFKLPNQEIDFVLQTGRLDELAWLVLELAVHDGVPWETLNEEFDRIPSLGVNRHVLIEKIKAKLTA